MTLDSRTRWLALLIVCLGDLMIVLDVTIVGVALPSIKADLGFSDTSLAWVVNAYLLTYGGFLLLGGRLGDLYGHRRLFLIGISVFTLASLVCGLATSQGFLVVARSVQGVGGAVASAVSLSLMVNLFTDPGERAKAMGIFGFVAAGDIDLDGKADFLGRASPVSARGTVKGDMSNGLVSGDLGAFPKSNWFGIR